MDFTLRLQSSFEPTRQAVHNGKSLTLPPKIQLVITPPPLPLKFSLLEFLAHEMESAMTGFRSRLGGVA